MELDVTLKVAMSYTGDTNFHIPMNDFKAFENFTDKDFYLGMLMFLYS